MGDLLGGVRLDYAIEQVIGLIQNPYSNLTAALLLMAAAVVFVLLVAMIIIAFVTRPSRRSQHADEEELRELLAVLQSAEDEMESELPAVAHAAAEPAVVLPARRRKRSWLAWTALVVTGVVLVVVAIGFTTSPAAVCLSCHESNPHADLVAAGGRDAHASVDCVRCHESSGLVGSVTIEVPARVGHMIGGISDEPNRTAYGTVASSACLRCHRAVRNGVVEDTERGIRMAHEQPLDSGAQCRDCHTIATGVVSRVTNGMSPCLRCHDGETESAECSLCHTKDVGAATRPSRNPAEMVGSSLIPTPDCGGCHDEANQCDPCHGGVRMPHSELFMSWGHARQGVEDLWYNNGEACATCHFEGRRPCTACHAFFPGHDVTTWPRLHRTPGTNYCDSCHSHPDKYPGRDFCQLCHSVVVEQ